MKAGPILLDSHSMRFVRVRFRTWGAALLLLAAPFSSSAPPAASAAKLQVLVLSDLHFDPMAGASDVKRLAAAAPEQWGTLLSQAKPVNLPSYRQDSNWWLLISALSYMKSTAPEPTCLLITGDFLAHHFEEKFKAAWPEADEKAYRDFVHKTMAFLAGELERTFPRTPILATLGNNDNDGLDYGLEPAGSFLHATEPIIRGLTLAADDNGFSQSWISLGSYSAHPPALPGCRVLSVNTGLLAAKYRYRAAAGAPEPGDRLLDWLDEELRAAAQAKEKVWMIFHVPPGIDGYATERQCGQGGAEACKSVVTMWNPRYQKRFETILAEHAASVTASFAGHTHMDDFRLMENKPDSSNFVLLTPGLSPWNGQNPAFRKLLAGPEGRVSDAETYYLNLAAAGTIEFPDWKPEYDFQRAWGVPQLDGREMKAIYDQSGSAPDAEDQWVRYYSVQHQSLHDIGPETFRALHCAAGTIDPDRYLQCYAGQ